MEGSPDLLMQNVHSNTNGETNHQNLHNNNDETNHLNVNGDMNHLNVHSNGERNHLNNGDRNHLETSYAVSDAGTPDGYDGSESGVEPDYSEWVFNSTQELQADIEFDMSDEQAMATLRYFTSTAQRTNMLTKTHSNDLDLISQLLSDKEKDLELTAKIGQSLLQRNKHLMMKIETMEDYLSKTTENAAQLEHDLQMKSKLVQLYAQDDEAQSTSSHSSKEYDKNFDDQELLSLTNRCRKLEKENQNLFSEALSLREMTDEMEDKEEGLVIDCIEQLSSAKEQITQLTDEIALKFEDNLQQQIEISQLINLVVELQRKQKQLVVENEDLQEQLHESNVNQDNLREQLQDMQLKFRETNELMVEHQEELKSLKSRLDNSNNPYDWMDDTGASIPLAHQDSLANEIEESVRRDVTSSLLRSKEQNKRLMENVRRHLNVRGSETTSGRTSPASNWSFASDERSESAFDLDTTRIRKPTRKLQIVKPLEGSDTLNKWHHLASKNVVDGLSLSTEEKRPPETENIDIAPTPVKQETNIDTSTDDGVSVHLAEKQKPEKRSPPQHRPRLLSEIDTPQKKTIITRNSAVLKSLIKGRKLLNSQQKGGRTQAEVIDMIATAMGKVNVEANAEQRILSSLHSSPLKTRKKNTEIRTDFEGMPNVTKALEKAAIINENDRQKNKSLADERLDTIESNSSNFDSGTEEHNYSTVTSSEYNSTLTTSEYNGTTTTPSEYSTKTRSSSIHSTSTTTPTETDLNSISGPLGLLSRANPSQPSPEIMKTLLRFSGTEKKDMVTMRNKNEKDTPSGGRYSEKMSDKLSVSLTTMETVGSSDGDGKRHSITSGSLVDMMINNRTSIRNRTRPVGLTSLINRTGTDDDPSVAENDFLDTIDGPEPELDVDDKTRTNLRELNDSSKSMETGLNSMNKEGTGLFGFFSFLGKLS